MSRAVQKFVEEIQREPTLREQLLHLCRLPALPAVYKDLYPLLPAPFLTLLHSMGISRLYSHQVAGIEAIRRGEHLALITPTASGKTLIYNLPILETIWQGKEQNRALYLFPMKALGQDQRKGLQPWQRLFPPSTPLRVAMYDGDTRSTDRRKIREDPPHVVISNPDMLHVGILPYHTQWQAFFSRLSYVVIDELHTYRGIFGTHVLHLLRRLRRICHYYGSNPQFITASATIAQGKRLAETLVGLPFTEITESGAPTQSKYFLLMNPEGSASVLATKLLLKAIEDGLKTIVFTKARKITELIYTWAIEEKPYLREKISAYRAGYLPEERREIERRLFSNELAAVISTSALEVGIDVGGLDLCILVGYPGSIVTTWQRSGRVGRGNREAAVILIGLEDALDQYFLHHPTDFFDRGYEEVAVDPWNVPITKAHLICGAAELPLSLDDPILGGTHLLPLLEELENEGTLVSHESGTRWFSKQRYPQRHVDIRSVGESFSITDQQEKLIGTIGGGKLFHECHQGAIYLHRARQYVITNIDFAKKEVQALAVKANYFTQPTVHKDTEILSCLETTVLKNFRVRLGRLRVREQVVGYQRKRIQGQIPLSTHTLDLPPEIFETIGFWIEIDPSLQERVEEAQKHFMGSIHAIEHAAISLFPLYALCDRYDIGGISFAHHPQVGMGAIFIYDGYPGGIGLAEKGFQIIEDLLTKTLHLIQDCSCLEGCPSCIHSPKCGSGNKPLDKAGATLLLNFLLADQRTIAEYHPLVVTEKSTSEPERGEEERKGHTMKHILFFDLETQRSAEEVGGWEHKEAMGLAVGVIWDEQMGEFEIFQEDEVFDLIERLRGADLVIGFNLKNFDYAVLKGYKDFPFSTIPTLDILEDVQRRLGFRLSLGHLAEHTLHISKGGDGLQSLEWFKSGEIAKVIQYCCQDVEITRQLFYHGQREGYLYYARRDGERLRLPVEWSLDRIGRKGE